MARIVLYALIMLFGLIAQLIDGSLGMGYGVTSTSLLLSIGFGTAIASAVVHLSEIFTTLASGIFHFKLGNVDKKIFKYLVISGVFGGALGAYTSVKLQKNEFVKPFISGILLLMGILIILKNIKKVREEDYLVPRIRRLLPLGLIASFIDAIGGGGWGPIATPSLILTNAHPKKTVGSVNFAEFFVTLTISFTFILMLPKIDLALALPLTIGGVIAAPIAALITSKINHKKLSILVGVFIILLSIRTILKATRIGFFF